MRRVYTIPDNIFSYGRAIGDFSDATKKLVGHLRYDHYTDDEIAMLVGHSPYNGMEMSGNQQAVEGPKEYQAGLRMPHTGLFGAFFLLHVPEMQLAKQLPGILGKHYGVQLQRRIHGVTYRLPLHQVKIDFQGQPPAVLAAEAMQLHAADGSHITIQSGETILGYAASKRSALNNKAEEAGQLAIANPYVLVDNHGKTLKPYTTAVILWGSLGAKGMKILTPMRRYILQNSGTDDDFTAQRFMIGALKDLLNRHQINVMPYFQTYVDQAYAQLQQRPDYLAHWAIAAQLDRTPIASQVYHPQQAKERTKLASSFQQAAKVLQIELPRLLELQSEDHSQHGLWKDFTATFCDTSRPSVIETQIEACGDYIAQAFARGSAVPFSILRRQPVPFKGEEALAKTRERIALVHACAAMVEEQGYRLNHHGLKEFQRASHQLRQWQPQGFEPPEHYSYEGKALLEYVAQRIAVEIKEAAYREERMAARRVRRQIRKEADFKCMPDHPPKPAMPVLAPQAEELSWTPVRQRVSWRDSAATHALAAQVLKR